METVPASALAQIPWFNPRAADGRSINLMPYWDGTTWHTYFFHDGKAIPLQIVDVDASDYLAAAPQRSTDIRIPFAEIMWQRASFPETTRFIGGILADFSHFSASVSKLKFLHSKRTDIPNVIEPYVKTELEYLLSLSRGVFDLLQELLSVLWKSCGTLIDPEKEKIRKQRVMPKSFADMILTGKSAAFISAEEIAAKWGLSDVLAVEYTQAAPFFKELRDWRDRILHGGSDIGLIFVDDEGFKVATTNRVFSWLDCWSTDEITATGLASIEPWLAQIIFRSMDICSRFAYIFAQVIQLPEPIAPGLMVFSRNPTDDALHELKRVFDRVESRRSTPLVKVTSRQSS